MKKGFTLIELIVVVAILGILFAVIWVSMDGVRKKTKENEKSCKQYSERKAEQVPVKCFDYFKLKVEVNN